MHSLAEEGVPVGRGPLSERVTTSEKWLLHKKVTDSIEVNLVKRVEFQYQASVELYIKQVIGAFWYCLAFRVHAYLSRHPLVHSERRKNSCTYAPIG
jgi:hypothetical protein